jgi:hypothetical protein
MMNRLRLSVVALLSLAVGLLVIALPGCDSIAHPPEVAAETASVPSQTRVSPPGPSKSAVSGKGMAAIQRAAEARKYLFVFFFKVDDDQTVAMRKVFETSMAKVAGRAQAMAVNVTESTEKPIVDKFDLGRAPMPLILAIAPNGAITGGFPNKVEERQLLDAFATPCTEKVMKQLQEGKLVFVCVQNAKTKSNEAAMHGVRDFKADGRFGHATEIVALDPADQKEAVFLADLQVAPEAAEAVTVFLCPPGTPIAKYEGATSKDVLVEALGKANTSCGPGGCAPGGCAPKK